MNDRAAPERLAVRILLRTDLDGPTCGKHGALVNPLHAGTKAKDAVVHGWMRLTHEDIQLDSNKSKALFMAVGWNASPVGALIYAMSKYCALKAQQRQAVLGGPEVRGLRRAHQAHASISGWSGI